MVRKSLFVGGALLLLAGLFFGRDAYSYISTTVCKVHEKVKSNVPVGFEIARVRQMIKDLDPEIRNNMHRIAREEVEVAKLEKKVERQEELLAKERRDILRLKNDLESGSQYFVYAGTSYSSEQVTTELDNRFQTYKTSESTADQNRQILHARRGKLTAARQKLEEMLAQKKQLAVEVENLEARMEMVEVAQTTSEFNFDDSRLSRTKELIDDITTRLEVAEKLLNADIQVFDRIELDDEETGEESGDVVDAVTRYFADHPVVESLAGDLPNN